jgi:sulfate adenylyltransferase
MTASPAPGVTVFLTGLSGAGKSTIADALVAGLEGDGRPVTVLDGDVVRTHLSSELSFSREHRDLNIRRIGWVAGEVVKHGGTVVVAAIAPYEAAREEARKLVEEHGRFVLVHLSTPLEVCEQRDVKGLYARARAGELPAFTGVSDPYEVPERPEVVIDTSVTPLPEAVARIRAAMDGDTAHRG